MKDAHKMLNESTSSSSCSGSSPMQVESPMLGEVIKKQKNMSLQEEEMERAKNQGLPVDFNILTFHSSTPCAATNTAVVVSQEESQETQKKIRRVLFTEDEDDDDDDEEKFAESQVPVVSSRGKKGGVYYWPYGGENTKNKKVEDELDRWEKQAPEEDDLLVDYEDSDDDLL